MIRTDPVTGAKGIFVNAAFITHIKDVGSKQSTALPASLYEHARTPEFTCRFTWRQHSIAFWDNRCAQHYPIADYWPARRRMYRLTINGDRPA